MDQFLRHRINVGRAVVREQVAFFRKQFAHVESEWKEDHSRVTFADFAISEKILAELKLRFPKDDLCTEEGDPHAPERELKARYAWILDPVDGTNNFALGMPLCAISLGLLRNGEPVYGFLYDYGRDKLIEGGPGIGLTDGGAKVHPMDMQRAITDQTMIGMSFPIRDNAYAKGLRELANTMNIRSFGTGAITLAYVALGMLDGCIDLRSKSWDIAASLAFLNAAGGKIHYFGPPHFPLKRFDVHQKPCPFYAGTEEFCAKCEKLLG